MFLKVLRTQKRYRVTSSQIIETYNAPFCMYDHMTLLECIRNASPGSYVIHNEIILHPISTEKGFIAVYNSVWTKHSVPSAWRGGSTAFCRVPFHSNSYELIITRHLPLRLHRPLRNLKIILLHILPKVPLLFHLST
jgi:hypothetical protein